MALQGGPRSIPTPTSRLRLGLARAEITPPVGIYHRMWGAARHDRATGVHRPIFGDVLVLAPADGSDSPLIWLHLDMVGLAPKQQQDIRVALADVAGVRLEAVLISFSHSHSSGVLGPDRIDLPGGELIAPYQRELAGKLREAGRQAVAGVQDVDVAYAAGRCNLAANRDYWDEALGSYVCGTNPDAPADDTVLVSRVTDAANRLVGTIVNYACHPTTLAWENTLISPDYVGAMREVVEQATGAPCVFMQGASGDLGPRDNYVGGPAVADRNGRQLGYAALSALSSLGPPATDFEYEGPVISGATLGVWRHVPLSPERAAQVSRFSDGAYTVNLPLKPRPARDAVLAQLEEWQAKQGASDARGDKLAARDAGARVERARRWLGRLASTPTGTTYPLRFSVYRLGDSVWVACGGEPYSALQVEIRRRFPGLTVLFTSLTDDLAASYMLTADLYGKGLYQDEVAVLAPGCLESLANAIAARIEEQD